MLRLSCYSKCLLTRYVYLFASLSTLCGEILNRVVIKQTCFKQKFFYLTSNYMMVSHKSFLLCHFSLQIISIVSAPQFSVILGLALYDVECIFRLPKICTDGHIFVFKITGKRVAVLGMSVLRFLQGMSGILVNILLDGFCLKNLF